MLIISCSWVVKGHKNLTRQANRAVGLLKDIGILQDKQIV